MRTTILMLAAACLLAACGGPNDGGATMSIDTGNGTAQIDGSTGQVTLDTPLIKGSVKLPRLDIAAENFEIGGVRLFPGTKIGAVNINGRGEGDGIVRVAFDSPAAIGTVRDWLVQQFQQAGTKVEVRGDSLTGAAEGKKFRIDLKPAGDRATGEVTIG